MKSLAYKIVYKNNTCREDVLNDLERSDLDAASIKYQIAKENGLSFENFKIYAVDPQDSTKIPLTDGETLTESYKIVELYEQELLSGDKEKPSKQRKGSDNSLAFQETSQLIVDRHMDYQEIQPTAPAHVYGVFRISRMLKCFSKERFFELNPDVFVINIYESRSKFPKKPELTIPILMISKLTRLIKAPCFSTKSYMQIITTDSTVTISFDVKSVCSQWIKLIKQAITYAKYVESKRATLKDKWRPPPQHLKIELVDEPKDVETNQRRSNRSDPPEMYFTQEQSPPVLFEHFEFELKVGNGSFGLVYLGRHKQTGRGVAIKQLNKDKLIHRHQLKYAITQLKILKEVKHPFIVTLYYAFQTKQNLYLAMSYCPNGSLKQLIEDNEKLSVEDAVLYICQIILAIQYLHQRKVIYRDLKPENILMTQDYHVCLSDFGLSKTDVDFDQYTESFLGTPAYLAPEMVVNGRATQATDIYGIGAIMYEMLHGRMLYCGSNLGSIMNEIQESEPEIDSKLPKEVRSFLKCTLEKDPSKRIKKPREHPLFKNINWNGIMKKKVHPKVKVHQERSSLEWDIRGQQIDEDYNESNYLQNRVEGWIYARPL